MDLQGIRSVCEGVAGGRVETNVEGVVLMIEASWSVTGRGELTAVSVNEHGARRGEGRRRMGQPALLCNITDTTGRLQCCSESRIAVFKLTCLVGMN